MENNKLIEHANHVLVHAKEDLATALVKEYKAFQVKQGEREPLFREAAYSCHRAYSSLDYVIKMLNNQDEREIRDKDGVLIPSAHKLRDEVIVIKNVCNKLCYYTSLWDVYTGDTFYEFKSKFEKHYQTAFPLVGGAKAAKA